jgi:hypothetical protein
VVANVLHLLAEISDELRVVNLFELLGATSIMGPRLDRLVAFGILSERRDGRDRWMQLNKAYPAGTSLRRWLHWLNQHHRPDIISIAEIYRTRKAAGDFDSRERLRRTHQKLGRYLSPEKRPNK